MSKVMEGPDAADRLQDTLSEHQEVIRAIEPAVADHLRLLLPLDKAWQPTDYLPDLEMEGESPPGKVTRTSPGSAA